MKLRRIFTIAVFAILLETTVFATTGKITNASSGLILRKDASKSAGVITTLRNGTEVEVLEKNGDWYKVKYNDQEGYLFAEYITVDELELTKETEENENDVNSEGNKANIKSDINVYIMPQVTSTVINTFPKDTEVNIIETVGNWSYIGVSDTFGWVRNYKINNESKVVEQTEEVSSEQTDKNIEEKEEEKPEEKLEIKSNQPEENLKNGYINVESANVREKPSKEAKVVTTLLLNAGVEITGESGDWYEINFQDKYFGYIAKELISAKQQ